MIASSLREGDEVVDLLLSKEADVTMKSELSKEPGIVEIQAYTDCRGQF